MVFRSCRILFRPTVDDKDILFFKIIFLSMFHTQKVFLSKYHIKMTSVPINFTYLNTYCMYYPYKNLLIKKPFIQKHFQICSQPKRFPFHPTLYTFPIQNQLFSTIHMKWCLFDVSASSSFGEVGRFGGKQKQTPPRELKLY